MRNLTKAERATLDKAEALLISLLSQEKEVLMFSLHHGWAGISATYFSPLGIQHSGIWPVGNADRPTLADKVQRVIDIQAQEAADAPNIKAGRIESLRAELAELTGEAA